MRYKHRRETSLFASCPKELTEFVCRFSEPGLRKLNMSQRSDTCTALNRIKNNPQNIPVSNLICIGL